MRSAKRMDELKCPMQTIQPSKRNDTKQHNAKDNGKLAKEQCGLLGKSSTAWTRASPKAASAMLYGLRVAFTARLLDW
eukprot:scaffold436795_cov17-Prasinocladus_malaysianus.AAC.1